MISFIYEWLDTKTNLKYIGRHVGELDDGYIGSGTIFKKEYKSRPKDFIRNILWQHVYTDDEAIKLKEEEFLNTILDDELYYGPNRKYYNQVRNSHGFNFGDNPMKNSEIVARMVKTQKEKGYKGPYHNTVAKYGKDEWDKMNSQSKLNNTYGSGNKDKDKSADHKENIRASVNKVYERKRKEGKILSSGGRPRTIPYEELINTVKEKGFKESAKELGLSLAALKGRYYNAISALKK
jgi:hypothetical protein